MSQIQRYSDCKHNITFELGNEYQNFIGRYRIEDMEINENDPTQEPLMLIQYTDILTPNGKPLDQILPIREQGRIVRNAIRRLEHYPELQTIDFNSSDFLTTAAYLSQHARIRVECPQSLHNSFQTIYRCLTGDEATNHYGHGYAVVNDLTKGTSFELRINFPTPSDSINLFNLPIVASPNRLEINYVDFVIQLFKMGFTIGGNQANTDKIFDSLSELSQDLFCQGLDIIPASLAA